MSQDALQLGSNDNPDATPPAIPDIRLIKPVGQGAFGVVWLGEETMMPGVFRAVKILHARPAGGSSRDGALDVHEATGELSATALRELEGLRAYQTRASGHPHLVEVHRVGMVPSGSRSVYYVMDAADHAGGAQPFRPDDYRPQSLEALVRSQERLTPRVAAEYARQLLNALDHLHAGGVRHRDVKPSNVLFIRGQLKLADLGLAAAAAAAGGTRPYVPPESQEPDDLYAAGMVLYQMLTGFSASRFPEWPAELRPAGAPGLREVRAVMSRACSRDPQERFRTAREMERALAAAMHEVAPRRARTLRASVAVALALLAGWGGFALGRRDVTELTRYGVPPYDGSQQEPGPELPGEDRIGLSRVVGTETVTLTWLDSVGGNVQAYDIQMRFEGADKLAVAGGLWFALENNPVALTVHDYDPGKTGAVMQAWLVLLDPGGKPVNDACVELLYWGQPESMPGTHLRFFDRIPLDGVSEIDRAYSVVLVATMAVDLDRAIEFNTPAALLEPEHYRHIATIVRRR
ncbi:MAG: protein kinase domain-containing protein [Phycisphaerae bacterium]